MCRPQKNVCNTFDLFLVEDGIYVAITDGPGAMQFNISDLSTIGNIYVIILIITSNA